MKKDSHEMKHHLEIPDADACITNKQCVSLVLEIDRLRKNITGWHISEIHRPKEGLKVDIMGYSLSPNILSIYG